MHVHTHTHAHTLSHTYTHTYAYTHTYTHSLSHTLIHTHTHTHCSTSRTSWDLSSTSGMAPAPSDLGVTGSEDPKGTQRLKVQNDDLKFE